MLGAFYMPVVSVGLACDVQVFMEYSCILVLESEIFILLLFLHKSTESYG